MSRHKLPSWWAPLIVLALGSMFAAHAQVAGAIAAPSATDATSATLDGEQPQHYVGPAEAIDPPPVVRPILPPSMMLDFIGVGVPEEGDTPAELAFTPDGTKIVIAHRDSQNLVVFDAATRTVLDVIGVSGSPNSLAISSDGDHVVTTNLFEDTASIVSLASGTEVAVVNVGAQPGIVRITPDGATAIVGNTLDSSLSVVDIASGTEVRVMAGAEFWQLTSFGSWAVMYRFTDFAITPDSATVIFPARFNDQVRFYDIATGNMTPVASNAGPAQIDLSADGATAVVSHDYPASELSVVNVTTQSITKTIATGAGGTFVPAIAIKPDASKAVMAVQNAVKVINLSTDAVSASLSTGSPNDLITTADGLYVVVGNYMGSIVSFASESIVASTLNTTTPDYLAVSPANARAATAHVLRKEVMEVMNVNGASGFLEGVVPTGPPPEGDKARGVAVNAAGTMAIVINNHSQNATVIDLTTDSISAVYDTGERPGDVALTPDETKAVVANLDSYFATVIDLVGGTTTDISMGRRGSTVAISPDGTYAYIPVVASGDGVYRINLNTLALDGPKISTADMGGIGFVFDLASGMTLSHDGATLAVCGSFTDQLSIIDTASWAEVQRVAVGDFPVRAVFSPDDSLIYVSNKNDDTVSVVTNDGPSSTTIATIPVGDQPFEMALNPAGTTLYLAVFNDRTIAVIDTGTNAVTNTIALPQPSGAGQPVGLHVSIDGKWLYVACNGADYHLISTTTESIVKTVNTGLAPTELKFNDATNCGFMPSPLGGDGLNIVCTRLAPEAQIPAGQLNKAPAGPSQAANAQPAPLP